MGEGFDEMGFHMSKINTVLRSLWTSKSWLNGGQIKFEGRSVCLLSIAGLIPQSLRSCIGFHASNRIVFTAAESHVIEGAFIDGEETAGCTIFWSHVGNCCAVSQGESNHTSAKEFDKFANYAMFTEHLNNSEGHVSSGHAGVEFAD